MTTQQTLIIFIPVFISPLFLSLTLPPIVCASVVCTLIWIWIWIIHLVSNTKILQYYKHVLPWLNKDWIKAETCCVLMSTPESQQPNPGCEWYQPTTISGLKQNVKVSTNWCKMIQTLFMAHKYRARNDKPYLNAQLYNNSKSLLTLLPLGGVGYMNQMRQWCPIMNHI